MENKSYRVLVGIPTMGSMEATLVSTIIRWVRRSVKDQLAFYFTFKVQPVERARNEIVKYFLNQRQTKGGGPIAPFTHLLFVDSDTIPPVDALEKLMAHDKDIISGITPILHYDKERKSWGTMDNCFIKYTRDVEGKIIKTHAVERDTGLQKIEKCGGSCLLIKREVFDKLEKPYFRFLFNEDGTEPVKSEDLYFCEKAKEAGFDVWCDTSVICNHHKSVVL